MSPSYDATAAWHELLDGLRGLEGSFLDGDRAVQGEQAVADGYRMLATILGVGLDTYLFAEPSRPIASSAFAKSIVWKISQPGKSSKPKAWSRAACGQ